MAVLDIMNRNSFGIEKPAREVAKDMLTVGMVLKHCQARVSCIGGQ